MRRTDIFAITLFIGIICVFFYKTLLFGLLPVPTDDLVGLYHPYRDLKAAEYPNGIPYKNFLITDPVRQQIPWRKSVVDSLKKGMMPTWGAGSFSGTPLLANIQSGVFYPFNIVFFVLPFPIAWTVIIISQSLFAGIFFYIFLRVLQLSEIPSLFGAILFSFSGSSIAWLTWGTILSAWMWTPLALASVHKLLTHDKRRKWVWEIAAVITVASSFFAGHLQIFFYSCLLIGIYAAWTAYGYKKIHWILPVIGVALASFAIIYYQLSAVLKWLPLTGRLTGGSLWHAEGFFIPVWHLVQFIAPDFFGNPATLNYWGTWNYGEMIGYIGIAGIIFALMGIRKQTWFWFTTMLVAVLFAVASPVSEVPYLLRIPFISSLQPTRLLFIVDLCLSVLAAYGISWFMSEHKKRILVLPITGVGVILALMWVVGRTLPNAQVIMRNLVMSTALFAVMIGIFAVAYVVKHKGLRKILAVIVIGIVSFDLLRFGWKFTPFTDLSLFFPETKMISYLKNSQKPFRTMTLDDRILPPDTNTYYGIESVNGYDPIHSLRYEQFIAAMERGEANITPPYGYERIMVPKNIESPLFNLLNVRYIFSFSELSDKRFKKVMNEGQTLLYENMSVLPRVYLAQKVIFKNTDQEIMNELYNKKFDYRFDAIVEHPVDVLNFELNAGESATLLEYQSGRVTIQTKTIQPRLLVLGNMYNPRWHATIDSKPATIVRTNYLFMSISVPSGDHKIQFSYN